MNTRIHLVLELCCVLIVSPLVLTSASVEAATPSGPVEVAGRYLDAMESSDLDAAGKLFSATSSVFESGGREGAWAAYREHHFGPENGEIKSFKINRGEPETGASKDGSMAFVAWPIEYRIDLIDRRINNVMARHAEAGGRSARRNHAGAPESDDRIPKP